MSIIKKLHIVFLRKLTAPEIRPILGPFSPNFKYSSIITTKMSKKLEDSSDIKLDALGNIDTRKLEKSLKEALEFDIQYKQRDNMKKRACKVAGSYDEFKAMVDCAHLKKVTRQEVESLRAVKKGWTKSSSSTTVAKGANILSQEDIQTTKSKQSDELRIKLSSGGFRAPRTPLELERDFKRQTSSTDQLR
jgi:hypothetical protein